MRRAWQIPGWGGERQVIISCYDIVALASRRQNPKPVGVLPTAELFTLLRFAPVVQANYRDCVTSRPVHASGLDDALAADLARLRASDRERSLRQVGNRRGAVVETEHGVAVDFSSNDYLGLA